MSELSPSKNGCSGWVRAYLWKSKEELEAMTAYELEQFRIKQRMFSTLVFYSMIGCPILFCFSTWVLSNGHPLKMIKSLIMSFLGGG